MGRGRTEGRFLSLRDTASQSSEIPKACISPSQHLRPSNSLVPLGM